MVKQALCVAANQIHRYGPLVRAIVGIVFLSTPHQYGDKKTTCLRYRDVLESTAGKAYKFSSSNTEQEGATLLNLAERFRSLALQTPILSVYELKDSEPNSVTLKKSQLVCLELCWIIHANCLAVGQSRRLHDWRGAGNSFRPQSQPP